MSILNCYLAFNICVIHGMEIPVSVIVACHFVVRDVGASFSHVSASLVSLYENDPCSNEVLLQSAGTNPTLSNNADLRNGIHGIRYGLKIYGPFLVPVTSLFENFIMKCTYLS